MYPVVAMLLSVVLEGYKLHWQVLPGIVIILAGSGIAMGKLPIPGNLLARLKQS